jgi:cysteine-rich repeat protein
MKRWIALGAVLWLGAACGSVNPGARCGDGTLDPNEACDDGNQQGGDGCRADCSQELCGDGTLDPGEVCDDGNDQDGDACSGGCLLVSCGDGILDAGEQCDDNNAISGDGCDANCRPTGCGNGVQTFGEQCDDGNQTSNDGCDANCTVPGCGNGIVNEGEACDDANGQNGDGCRVDCSQERCGDNILDPNEACDDGNTTNDDGCRADCLGLEGCGDGLPDPGEPCDDGNNQDGDGCSALCAVEVCGDGVVQPGLGERCDDGNTTNDDECPNDCSGNVVDLDGDGFSQEDDDCNEGDPLVNPAAFEVPGDGLDNDCDGLTDAVFSCDTGLDAAQPLSFARALGLCTGEVDAAFAGPSNPQGRAILGNFGNSGNAPHEGASQVYFSTGKADTNDHNPGTDLLNTFPSPILGQLQGCGDPSSATARDYTELALSLTVPSNANSFSLVFQFFSSEYPIFRCSNFSDSFAALLSSENFSGNLAQDATQNGISVNSRFFLICNDDIDPPAQDCTVEPTPTLAGTGYDLDPGGATLPLLLSAPVVPGEEIVLRLLILDDGDGLFDSSVLLDRFSWSTEVLPQRLLNPL